MANVLYDGARVAYARGVLNWEVDAVNVQLIDVNNYSVAAGHEFLTSIPSNARVGAPVALQGKSVSVTGGHLAAATYMPNVSGPEVRAVVLYYNSGVESSSRLLVYLDTMVNLPFTPSGIPVFLNWNNNSSGIFRL